ncbi:MAG: glycosyltransferase family 2 protein [Sedimentisphaerales bacterium]|nr:glycosyltransferase family 2 protein [Sedimentisphaerales bacterium]
MDRHYVIITPAFNESKYIKTTIEGVLAQSLQPISWVIVDDGSTDGTGEIVKEAMEKYGWIHYLRREKISEDSYYASNVYALLEGIKFVSDLSYTYLAILDADISLPSDYYKNILDQFERDKRLGVASGVYVDRINGGLRKVLNDRRSTPKAIQVFRRECYEQIGGYVPLKYGGEDTCTCIMARMKGWKSWSFPEFVAIHNKPIGTGHTGNYIGIRFKQGLNEYGLATHPLFMVVKSIRRCFRERPFLLGGISRLFGYIYGYILHEKRQIPDEVVRFLRKEQINRIFALNAVPADHSVDS